MNSDESQEKSGTRAAVCTGAVASRNRSEHSTPSLRPRLELIDQMRGLASLSVAWFHLTNQYGEQSVARASGAKGWLGVELFFVISGFVIPLAINRWRAWRIRQYLLFLRRRFVRVEFPFLASILVVLALEVASESSPSFRGVSRDFDVSQLLANALYVVPFTSEAWLQPVYWTLAFECAFYLSLGLVFTFAVSAELVTESRVLTFAAALSACILTNLIPHYWGYFLMGILSYRCHQRSNPPATFHLSVIVAALVTAIASSSWLGPFVALFGASAMILRADNPLPNALGRGLLWLGSISYSLYLVHVPVGGRVVNLGRRFIGESAHEELLLSSAALVMSAGFAWCFYRLLELPAQRWARNLR